MEHTDVPQPEIAEGTAWKTVTPKTKSSPKKKRTPKPKFNEARAALDPELREKWES